jgi:hypothetical protein
LKFSLAREGRIKMKKLLRMNSYLIINLIVAYNFSDAFAMQSNPSDNQYMQCNLLLEQASNNEKKWIMQELEIPAYDTDLVPLLTDSNEKQEQIREILNKPPFANENILSITPEEADKIRKFFDINVKRDLLSRGDIKIVQQVSDAFYKEKNSKLQVSFLPKLALLGKPNAQFWFSMRTNDNEERLRFLKLAASQGHPEALVELGRLTAVKLHCSC